MTLATIQKIEKINPIPNADNIEVAKVLGWEVVVRKGKFKAGDLCIYIEIDTLLPRKEWSEFLFKHEEDTEYRLRTIKLRGQISQGLVLPISIVARKSTQSDEFIYDGAVDDADTDLFIGRDVTYYLGIKKYEKPTPTMRVGNQQVKTRSFPHFLRKTDEVRIQSAPELLEKLKGKPYYITQKLDGTSATYYKYKGKFGVCSRNLEIPDPRKPSGFFNLFKFRVKKMLGKVKKEIPELGVYWEVAIKYRLEEMVTEGYAVQGEICGPGIQGNKMGLDKITLFIFNVFDINSQEYIWPWGYGYNHEEALSDFVPFVPILFYNGNNTSFDYDFEHLHMLIKLAEDGYYPNGSPQEGIVIRSLDQTVSFKVINNKFLLKYGE